MDRPPLRRLNLGDLVILVASSAVGMLILRVAHEARGRVMVAVWDPPWSWKVGREVVPFLISTAAGLLVARMLRPRPAWRRLARQPGAIACLAIVVDVALGLVIRLGYGIVASFRSTFTPIYPFDTIVSGWMFSGRDVAMAWGLLILLRAGRPEPSWIDRAGRGLGIAAIVLWIAVSLSL